MIDVRVTNEALNVQSCADLAMTAASGGVDMFIGTVRSETKGKRVVQLEFEAYKGMAENEMKKIAEYAMQKWTLNKVLIHHRIGVLQIKEIPVIIAVAAAHRAEAFDACRYIIDTLKQTVPIWKKEIFEDGEVWVAAHP